MAKTIATISGTALAPGVSRNRRWYKPHHVTGAVAAAQRRLAEGARPMVMLTHHEAGDDSKEIAASLTSISLAEDGSARFTADLTDTPAGWTIARLADTSDGQPAHLKNVSIRGAWTGRVRKERAPDGQLAETGEGLELDGLDFTKAPGVNGAEIKAFAWAADGQTETEDRVLITESVEATVTVTEDTSPEPGHATGVNPPQGVLEVMRLFLGEPVAEADGEVEEAGGPPAISKRGSGMSGGGRVYADPGYQPDKKQRYDITDKGHALTAWRYINQKSKAARYTSDQLKRIKRRIRSALKKFGVKTSDEAAPGWGFTEAFEVTGDVLEWMGDRPDRSGSWCVSASNGPVNLNLSSYCMDPADLDVILRAAADAACKALAALDPDMDGDVDVPGATSSDGDGDGGKETTPDPETPATETASAEAGEVDPAPAGSEEGDPAMAAEETSTTSETGGAALTLSDVREAAAQAATAAVTEALKAERAERKAAKKAARKAAEAAAAAAAPATETAPAEGGQASEGEGTVAESEEDRINRIVAERLAAAGVQPPVEETEEDRINRLVTERVQGLVADGSVTVQRAGIIEHAAPTADNAKSPADLAKLDEDSFREYAGGALDVHLGNHSNRINPVHT